VGAETSKTRHVLLDGVEQLMRDEGYAAVTYRAVAAKAGVTPGLVQYYFPTLDDLFVAAIRRRAGRNLDRLADALRTQPDRPLRVVWEFSRDEVTAALMTEFTALGNHRKTIRSEIAAIAKRIRKVQLDAVKKRWRESRADDGDLPPDVLLFLLTGIPKLIKLEEGIGVSTAHAEVVEAFERYLDSAEPRPGGRKRKRKSLLTTGGRRA